jgi:hypothetical protein
MAAIAARAEARDAERAAGAAARCGGCGAGAAAAAAEAALAAARAHAPPGIYHGPAADSVVGERALDALLASASLFAQDLRAERFLCDGQRARGRASPAGAVTRRGARLAARDARLVSPTFGPSLSRTMQLIHVAAAGSERCERRLTAAGAPLALTGGTHARAALHWACSFGCVHIAAAPLKRDAAAAAGADADADADASAGAGAGASAGAGLVRGCGHGRWHRRARAQRRARDSRAARIAVCCKSRVAERAYAQRAKWCAPRDATRRRPARLRNAGPPVAAHAPRPLDRDERAAG